MAGHMSDEAYSSAKKAVWRVTVILGVVTIIEILMALLHHYEVLVYPKMMLNILMIVMSLAKAFFIVGEFMHLKYEVRALILSILVPLLFLVWFIIAFLMEGDSWRLNRIGIFN